MAPRPHPLLQPGTRPLIGVIHLPPTSGPEEPGIRSILERAASDAKSYAEAGFDAVLVENYGDAPFPKDFSPPHVAATLARVSYHVRETTGLPVGVNVLRNDAKTALGVAVAAQCDFIRVNVLTGAVVADQGLIEGCAHELATYRRFLGEAADRVFIAADVDVKHAAPLADRPIGEEARDIVERGGADAVLLTGRATGAPVDPAHLLAVREQVEAPVWAASGVNADTIAQILEQAHGAIVGSAAKKNGDPRREVDPEHARAIAQAAGKKKPTGRAV